MKVKPGAYAKVAILAYPRYRQMEAALIKLARDETRSAAVLDAPLVSDSGVTWLDAGTDATGRDSAVDARLNDAAPDVT